MLLTLLLLGIFCESHSQTLHAIMIPDVEDAKLGGISLCDEKKILQILETAEWGTGLKLKTYYHNRSGFTASAIREKLQSLSVQPREAVFSITQGWSVF